MTNKDVFIEIPVTDHEKAKDFYSKVFGWKIIYWPKMDVSTFYFEKPGPDNEAGGFRTQKEIIDHKGVLVYFTVNDMNNTLKKVKENNGRVIQSKTLISKNVGYQAIFTDCFGNKVGLYSKD